MSDLLVDANVLLDLLTDDPKWAEWSERQLQRASLQHRLIVNAVIYAEVSVGFARIEDLEAALTELRIALVELPRAALFLAGKAFQAYRRRGGRRNGVLPDFIIAAHAAVADCALLTRDARRFRGYFPGLKLIAP